MDFTFQNKLLKDYFEGNDSYVPTSELIYLHEHPLVIPNFLQELTAMIDRTGEIIIKHKIFHYSDKLESLAIRIGKHLPNLTQENAPEVLTAMREVYQLCKELTTKLN